MGAARAPAKRSGRTERSEGGERGARRERASRADGSGQRPGARGASRAERRDARGTARPQTRKGALRGGVTCRRRPSATASRSIAEESEPESTASQLYFYRRREPRPLDAAEARLPRARAEVTRRQRRAARDRDGCRLVSASAVREGERSEPSGRGARSEAERPEVARCWLPVLLLPSLSRYGDVGLACKLAAEFTTVILYGGQRSKEVLGLMSDCALRVLNTC